MAERLLISGNEAIGRGAIQADCKYFFGYPITPQNEIPEFMSKELPKAGGVFVQSESETASIYMVFGGAMTGKRVMTSTASPGFSLMQEGVSNINWVGVPCLVVNVTRLGPGMGSVQSGQSDYRLATKGGGHGDQRSIVLAPASPQECFDFVQLGFHLAEKYQILSLILSDYIVGQTAEPVEIRTLELPELPPLKHPMIPRFNWQMVGKGNKPEPDTNNPAQAGATRRSLLIGGHFMPMIYQEKHELIMKEEPRYEKYQTDDAELVIVAWGSSARFARGAVDLARAEGIKIGLFRLITLWPFPDEALRKIATAAGKVLVVEDNNGQMVEDVRDSVRHQIPVHLLDIRGRHTPNHSGVIQPERILEEVREVLK